MKRKLRSILAVVVGAAMLFSACSPKTDSTAPAATTAEAEADKTTTESAPAAPAAPVAAGEVTELPRNETLYINGLTWGPPANLSPFSTTAAFFFDLGRVLVYETLFMFNPMTGEMEPLLGTEYKWVDDTTLEVGINTAATFNNGEPMTVEDVVYSFNFHNRASTRFSNVWSYLDSVRKKMIARW